MAWEKITENTKKIDNIIDKDNYPKEIINILNKKSKILSTIESIHWKESDNYEEALSVFEKLEDEIPDTKSSLDELKSQIETLQRKEINEKKVNFAFDWNNIEKSKSKILDNCNLFLHNDLKLEKLSTIKVWWLLSSIYAAKELWFPQYIEKFKDKVSKNKESLRFIADHWENWRKWIDRKLQYKSDIIWKEIIKDCISATDSAIKNTILELLNKKWIKLDEKQENELYKKIDKILENKKWTNNLKEIVQILENVEWLVLSEQEKLGFLRDIKDLDLIKSKFKKEKFKQENPELAKSLEEFEILIKSYETTKDPLLKKKKLEEIEKKKDASIWTVLEAPIANSYSILKETEEVKILNKYSKSEQSSRILLNTIKSNESISLKTIDQAIKEQKIDLKTGKIDKKFLDEKWEINHEFSKENFAEIKNDSSWFLQDMPIWTELPVWETSNIVKKSDWTYDIKILDKITGLDKFDTEYKAVDKDKAAEIMKYINLFDEIGLSYLAPQLLKSWDNTILKSLWIFLDWKTSITWNKEEIQLLQKISKMFFPEESMRSDIYDLKLLFKNKLMNQWFMWLWFRWFAIDNYNKNKEKSIFDGNGMINPLKISS